MDAHAHSGREKYSIRYCDLSSLYRGIHYVIAHIIGICIDTRDFGRKILSKNNT